MNKEQNSKIKNILDEIYLIDPSLRKKEEQLIGIINKVIEAEPKIEINQSFIDNLKQKIFVKIEEENRNKNKKIDFNLYFKRFAYSFSAVAMVILLTIFISLNYSNKTDKDYRITSLGEKAFGDLNINFSQSLNNDNLEGVLGLGASEDMSVTSLDSISRPQMIEINQYKYVYQGDFLDNFDLSTVSSLVYRRVVNKNISRQAANNLSSISSNLPINLNSFNNKELVHFNFNEEKDYGYSVAVNLGDNTLSIFNNWSTWPQPYQDCYNTDCLEALRLKEADMLSENELIDLANNFIQKYGIDLSFYSKPEINYQSEVSILRAEYSSNYHYPEYMSVTYPLMINNQEVFNNQGNKEGVEISINLREKKVSGLSNLNFSNYQSATYDLIDNLDKVNKLINRGGLNPDYLYQQTKLIEVELDDPSIALVKTWLSSPDFKEHYELFIPCLIFPIKEKPNQFFYRQAVIIPLTKEIFENSLKQAEEMINNEKNNPEILPIPIILPDRNEDLLINPEEESANDNLYRILPID